MSITSLHLLNEIARCPVVAECKAGAAHQCSAVVSVQDEVALPEHQVPEPWSGHLDQCVVLFLSSNPSINEMEDYPRWGDPLQGYWEHFEDRFEGGTGQVKDGVYSPLADGGWSPKATKFWTAVRARSQELLPDVQPGLDYALTEVVHCKSRKEVGVRKAAAYCSARYTPRVLEAAVRAAVVVVYGAHARRALAEVLDIELTKERRHVPASVGALERHFVFLDHPASFGSVKRFETALSAEQFDQVRQAARAARASRKESA